MLINWQKIKQEAAGYLSQLIQINTSNPPGGEMKAIQYLKKVAESNGLHTKIQRTDEQRGNIIISLDSFYENPIMLLSHVDVVPANGEDWEVPPFSGAIIEDTLWGRGTIDTKQLTITHLMTLILLKRNKVQLKQSIVMVATSDEENGSNFGLLPLLKIEGELFSDSIVFNEGGGFPIIIQDQIYYLAEMGQKGVARIKLSVPPQQSPNPYMSNNSSMETMLEVIDRFMNADIVEPLPEITEAMFRKISNDQDLHIRNTDFNTFFDLLPQNLYGMFKAMSKTTFSITKWNGGRKHPTLKGNTEIFIDCRPLPHVTEKIIRNYIEEITDGLPVHYDLYEFSQGYETILEDDMIKIFEQHLQNEVKGSIVVPFLSIGSSDGRHLRQVKSRVYGYCPVLPDMSFDKVIKMVHGVNERIPLESFRFGIENMYDIIVSIGRSEMNEIRRSNHCNGEN